MLRRDRIEKIEIDAVVDLPRFDELLGVHPDFRVIV